MRDMSDRSDLVDGGPAFPCPALTHREEIAGGRARIRVTHRAVQGMTLRDYFAGQALGGLSADPKFDADDIRTAELAYRYADAMLKVREK